MIRAIMVDDEAKSTAVLSAILGEYHPQITVLGKYTNIRDARKAIDELKPQLLFLDVEMPGGTGFDLLQSFSEIDFEVIFVTAYDKYAVSAFRYASLDYLMKPVDMTLLAQAIERAEMRIAEKQHVENYKLLVENLGKKKAEEQHISVADGTAQQLVRVGDIMYCIAEGAYTWLHLADGRKYLSSRNLKEYEEMLPGEFFCRIHHSHIINTRYAGKLLKGRGGAIQMKDGTELEIAVRRKDDVLKMLRL